MDHVPSGRDYLVLPCVALQRVLDVVRSGHPDPGTLELLTAGRVFGRGEPTPAEGRPQPGQGEEEERSGEERVGRGKTAGPQRARPRGPSAPGADRRGKSCGRRMEEGGARKEEQLEAAAALYLRLGLLQQHCEILVELGLWERALSAHAKNHLCEVLDPWLRIVLLSYHKKPR